MSLKLEELVGKVLTEEQFDEAAGKKDACYHKVKARYDVWPSAYASGALVKCRKVGAANWGNKSKKKEGFASDAQRRAAFASGYEEKGKKNKKKESVESCGYTTSAVDPKYKLKSPGGTGKEDKKLKEFKCLCEACWKGYEKKGMKKMFGKMYPNCVKKEGIRGTTWVGLNEIYWENNIGEYGGITFKIEDNITEAEYQGREVKLGKIMQGDVKKFKVYVKNPKGNVVKVNFGHGGSSAKGKTMRIRKSNPKARANFRARHNCDNPGPRHKARYWSCRKW